jgi:hypothetical protein
MFRLGRRFRSNYSEQCRKFLVEETEAFLNGRLVDVVEAVDGPLPAWVEVNWVVHASPAELLEVGRGPGVPAPVGTWPWARAVLLRELLASSGEDLDAIAEHQRRCLIPVELDLMSEGGRYATPSDVVITAVVRLRHCLPRSSRGSPANG